jgi:membrane protease YdiL (CAAX protease family)
VESSLENSRPRTWAIVAQIGVVLFLIEGALWSHGRTQGYWFVGGFAALIICVLLSRPSTNELGLGLRGMIGASIAIPIAIAFSALTLFAAWQIGTLRMVNGTVTVPWHAFFYAIWALEQEFILNAFFYRRFEWLMGKTTGAVVVTALLFSLVHLPNPVLVPATFLGGLFFVSVFRKFRNIYPLAIAHAVLGLTIGMAFPDHWVRHMRVGIAFLRFHVRG